MWNSGVAEIFSFLYYDITICSLNPELQARHYGLLVSAEGAVQVRTPARVTLL